MEFNAASDGNSLDESQHQPHTTLSPVREESVTELAQDELFVDPLLGVSVLVPKAPSHLRRATWRAGSQILPLSTTETSSLPEERCSSEHQAQMSWLEEGYDEWLGLRYGSGMLESNEGDEYE